nr:hypothetical protein [Xanthomonas vasicola]
MRKHVVERVWLRLDPETVAQLHAVCQPVGRGFASVDDDRIVVGRVERTDAGPKAAGKEIVPGGESVMGRSGLADEVGCEVRHGSLCSAAEPAADRIAVEHVG